MTDEVEIIRRIYPKRSSCPECGSKDYRRSGNSRSGLILYRTCRNCRVTYRVLPIANEVDRGGLASEVRLW